MASFINEFIDRRITVRLATAAAVVAGQFFLILACVLALMQNMTLRERASTYLMWAAPLVGRDVPPITGLDRTGAQRLIEYNQDHRPTLVYSFVKNCRSCQSNWTAMRTIQAMSPDRLRIVYVNTYDKLTDEYLLEHGLAQDTLFSTLDDYTALSYQVRGSPQAELVDKRGRVVWTKLGAFRPADLATFVAAIETHERQWLVSNQGVER